MLSDAFKLVAGVRQAGVLSSQLFSVYVNDIIVNLRSKGCSLYGHSLSALMYADDLILLSPSLTELQMMVDICCIELRSIDLMPNRAKSTYLKVGHRWE